MAFVISPFNIVQGACEGKPINSMSSPLVAHPFYVTRHSFQISRQKLKFQISQSKDWEIKSTILNGPRARDWSIYTTLYTILLSDWWASYTTLSGAFERNFRPGEGEFKRVGVLPGGWWSFKLIGA